MLLCAFSAVKAEVPGISGDTLYGTKQEAKARAFLYQNGLMEFKYLNLVVDLVWIEPLTKANDASKVQEIIEDASSENITEQVDSKLSVRNILKSLTLSNRTSVATERAAANTMLPADYANYHIVGIKDATDSAISSRAFSTASGGTEASPIRALSQSIEHVDVKNNKAFYTPNRNSDDEDEDFSKHLSFSPEPNHLGMLRLVDANEDDNFISIMHRAKESSLKSTLQDRAAESQRCIIADARAFIEYVRNEVHSRNQSLASSVIHNLQIPFTNDLHDSLEREEILANVQHLLSPTNGVNTSKSNSPRQSSANNQEISQEMAGPHNSLTSVYNVQQEDAVADSNALVVQNNKKRDLASNKKTGQQTAKSNIFLYLEKAEESMLHQPNGKTKLPKDVAFSLPMQNVQSTISLPADQGSGLIQMNNDTQHINHAMLTFSNESGLIESGRISYQSSGNAQLAAGSNVYALSTNAEPLRLKNNELRLEDVQKRLIDENVNAFSNNTSRAPSPGPLFSRFSSPSLYLSNTSSPAIRHSSSAQRAERKADLDAMGERLTQEHVEFLANKAAARRMPSEEVERLIEKLAVQYWRDKETKRVIDTVRAQGGRANDLDYTISPTASPCNRYAHEDVDLHDFEQLQNFVSQSQSRYSAYSSLSRDSLSSPKVAKKVIESLSRQGKFVIDDADSEDDKEIVVGGVDSPRRFYSVESLSIEQFFRTDKRMAINRTVIIYQHMHAAQMLLKFAVDHMRKYIKELILLGNRSVLVRYQYDPTGEAEKGLARKSFVIKNNLPYNQCSGVVYKFASENLNVYQMQIGDKLATETAVGMIFDDIVDWKFDQAADTSKWTQKDWKDYFFHPQGKMPKIMKWIKTTNAELQSCFVQDVGDNNIAVAVGYEWYTYQTEGVVGNVTEGVVKLKSNGRFDTGAGPEQHVLLVPISCSSYNLAQYLETNLKESYYMKGLINRTKTHIKLLVLYFHSFPIRKDLPAAWLENMKNMIYTEECANAAKSFKDKNTIAVKAKEACDSRVKSGGKSLPIIEFL